MQHGYHYCLTEPMGRNFEPGFEPQLTPKQMLRQIAVPSETAASTGRCSPDRHEGTLNTVKMKQEVA